LNIINYIKKHKDEDFKEFEFTEVDNLILSLLPNIDFTEIVPSFKSKKITLKEAVEKLTNKNYKGYFISKIYMMLQIMKSTKRYGNIFLYNFMNLINDEMQFTALTIKLNDNSIYVAFAGTGTSIIGWEEDFKMAYLYPGASQKYATIYLNKTIGLFDKNVKVGGHSKGGNLAICSVMNSRFYIKRKITNIYNNDGPGFLKEQVHSKKYKSICNKIKMYVPEQSIIGMILYHVDDYAVVKSKSFNILQHDVFNWQCNNKEFIKTKLTNRSKNIEGKLTKKLEELPISSRINLINNVFDIFKNHNIKDTKDIKLNNLFKLVKNFKEIDKESQNLLIELLLIIFIK